MKGRPWNRITPNEERRILAVAREFPDLSSRQLSAWITDNEGFAVSESTVYRILRTEGLVKRQQIQSTAGKEYHTKTTGPHQMWATDASYFRVSGWGYYHLYSVGQLARVCTMQVSRSRAYERRQDRCLV